MTGTSFFSGFAQIFLGIFFAGLAFLVTVIAISGWDFFKSVRLQSELERERRLSAALRKECNERIDQITESMQRDLCLMVMKVEDKTTRPLIAESIQKALSEVDAPKIEQIRLRVAKLLTDQAARGQKEGT
jgi:hypothetical protein